MFFLKLGQLSNLNPVEKIPFHLTVRTYTIKVQKQMACTSSFQQDPVSLSPCTVT